MIAAASPAVLPLPAPMPVPVMNANGPDEAVGAGSSSSATGTATDDAAEGFLALLAALMNAPAAPPPPPASPENGNDVAGAAVVATSESGMPAATTATVVDITFTVTSPFRPAPAPARDASAVPSPAGATLRQLFPLPGSAAPKTASATAAAPAPVMVEPVTGESTDVVADIASDTAIAPAATDTADTASMLGDVTVLSLELGASPDTSDAPVTANAPAEVPATAVPPAQVPAAATAPSRAAPDHAPVRNSPPAVPGLVVPVATVTETMGAQTLATAASGDAETTAPVDGDRSPAAATPLRTARAEGTTGGAGITAAAVAAAAAPEGSDTGSGEQDAPHERSRDLENALPVAASRDAAPATASSLPLATEAPGAPVPTIRRETVADAAPLTARRDIAVPQDSTSTVLLETGEGSDRIRVSVRGSTVHATILTESAHHEALATRVDDLRRALGERGFTDAHVAVRVAAGAGESAPPAQPAVVAGAPTERSQTSTRAGGNAPEYGTPKQRQDADDMPEHSGRRRHHEEETE